MKNECLLGEITLCQMQLPAIPNNAGILLACPEGQEYNSCLGQLSWTIRNGTICVTL